MVSTNINLFDNMISYTNLDHEIIAVNDTYMKIFRKTDNELLGKKEPKVLNINHNPHSNAYIPTINKPLIQDEMITLEGETRYYLTKRELIFNKDTNSTKIKISRKDITFSKQYQVQYNEHKKLLTYIATGKPIEFILNAIIKSVENRNQDMICSILILDEDQKRLLKGASPSLPEFYTNKLDKMLIGEKVGSCGAAVYLKQRVVVSDISTHDNWKYAKNLARKANLHACWSQPFFSSKNKVLGSFAIYYKKIKHPTDFDLHLIEDIASIVGIAIEKYQYKVKEEIYKQKQKEQEELIVEKSKQAEEEILRSKNQLRSIIDAIPSLIFVKNAEGRFITVNKTAASAAGMGIEEIEGQLLEEIHANQEEVQIMLEDDRKSLISKGTLNIKHESYFGNDKDIKWLETIKIPHLGNAFEEPVVIGITTDITKIKESESKISELNKTLEKKVQRRTQELLESNKELRSAFKNLKETQKRLIESEKMASLGGLVAGVAHEINTPVGVGLTGITHFLEITKNIRKQYTDDRLDKEDFEDYLSTSNKLASQINVNLQRTVHLVKSFKQISADQTHEEKRTFELKEYFEEVIFSLNTIINKTNINIELNSSDSLTLNSYPGAYSQILTNLILNSIKHAFEKKEIGLINIHITKEQKNIKIVYKDNGKGISPKNLTKVFDPFFTTKRGDGGTGLGLNIIYNIITNTLKGQIQCESEKKAGVSFTIKIPL